MITYRVVNVSSRVSHMAARKCSDALKAKFSQPNDITVPEIEQLMTEFVRYTSSTGNKLAVPKTTSSI